MKYAFAVLPAALLGLLAQSSLALDTIKMVKGSANGTISAITSQEVTIQRSGRTEKIPVNEIESIKFDGEPPALDLARGALLRGDYANALKGATGIDAGAVKRAEIKQEIEYIKAMSIARQALVGEGEVNEAGKTMRAFVQSNANSFHLLDAAEVLGDLFLAAGAFPLAEAEYAKLEQANWPEMKMRGAVAKGRALQAQGKAAEALAAYDNALSLAGQATGPQAKTQELAATLGRASALADADKIDEAIAAIEKVIADADPADGQLHARAYLAMGNCLNKAGRKQDALLAYLHVDVLYFNFPQEHAEALSHLSLLWQELKNADRALQARQTLQEKYKTSRWAK